jgi:hypothetical protein
MLVQVHGGRDSTYAYIPPVRRTVVLALALVLAGCGETPVEGPRRAPVAAGPQQAELGWRESYPDASGQRLVFEVESLEVTEDGWAARVAVSNETAIPWDPRPSVTQQRYGVMLFATGDLGELEDAARSGGLPAARGAEEIEPAPPAVLAPGATWRARLAARGALPAGGHLRVVFGPLQAGAETPEGMDGTVVWITDRSYRLRP